MCETFAPLSVAEPLRACVHGRYRACDCKTEVAIRMRWHFGSCVESTYIPIARTKYKRNSANLLYFIHFIISCGIPMLPASTGITGSSKVQLVVARNENRIIGGRLCAHTHISHRYTTFFSHASVIFYFSSFRFSPFYDCEQRSVYGMCAHVG